MCRIPEILTARMKMAATTTTTTIATLMFLVLHFIN